jgi:hypothetical protein
MKKPIATLAVLFFTLIQVAGQSVLLFEDFEGANFAARGWYDGFPDQRTTSEFKNGTHSYAGNFAKGATTSGAGRHLFPATERVYLSYWVKYSSNWVGSGVAYHPHEWNILTTEDGPFQGPSDSYLTAYVEQHAGRPLLALQDGKNVDPNCILLNNNSYVGCKGSYSSYPFTEKRSVCSCNGLKGFVDRRDCFATPGSTSGYYSARMWDADVVCFGDNAGSNYKSDWHFVEAYFELNSITGGVGVANGKIRYWCDRKLMISSDSILFRTAIHPNMKFNQLIYGPYIGVGSPVNQTWWIDDLTVMDGLPVTGINQMDDLKGEFCIYPNPSTGKFRIDLEGIDNPGLLEIYHVSGARVFVAELLGERSREVALAGVPKGLYLARVYAGKDIYSLKFVIE